jgi:hypothetical protein
VIKCAKWENAVRPGVRAKFSVIPFPLFARKIAARKKESSCPEKSKFLRKAVKRW